MDDPRSSPPPTQGDDTTTSKKRSHEDVEPPEVKDVQSSRTVKEEQASQASLLKTEESQHGASNGPANVAGKRATTAPGTAKPMVPPSQHPPHSGQGTNGNSKTGVVVPKSGKAPTQPTNAGNRKEVAQLHDDAHDEETEQTSSGLGPPDEEIVPFDWADLQRRYHEKMEELTLTERHTLDEFNKLANASDHFFAIWARTSEFHEVDRSIKRLKTRVTFVQYHEDELEQKRQHYIKVVEAFKSALALLS